MQKLFYVLVVSSFFTLLGCASTGPTVVKTYDTENPRDQIAILRADKSKGLSIDGCDEYAFSSGARYILLQPGRHKIWFSISGQTLFEWYMMRDKKYIDAVAGHTYILQSKGGGIIVVGNKWFPEVVDVTDDPKLHLTEIPAEIKKK